MKDKQLIETRRFADENACMVYVAELSKKLPGIISIGWINFGEGAVYQYTKRPRFTSTEGLKNFHTYAHRNGAKLYVTNYAKRFEQLEFKESQAAYNCDR